MRQVVLTGAGHVGPTGAGLEGLYAALDTASVPLSTVPTDGGYHKPGSPNGALTTPDNATKGWIKPLIARRMSKPSRMAVCAARMAVIDAGLAGTGEAWEGGEETATCFGTAWGGTNYTLRLLQQIETKGPEAISPFLFMETVANASAGQVALDLKLRGANLTLTQREASGVCAVARGAALVASGRAERVFVASVDEISPILHGILCRFGAVTASERPRPLNPGADGFLPAEGCTVYVLESEQAAAARKAPVHARIRAWGRANDPTASATDWGTGSASLAAAMTRGLERFDVSPDSIRRIASGACGAPKGDRLESAVLTQVFATDAPPVLTPKAQVGEYGGGFLGSALWALNADSAPSELLPLGDSLEPARRLLVTTLASGGPAAWFVLEQS